MLEFKCMYLLKFFLSVIICCSLAGCTTLIRRGSPLKETNGLAQGKVLDQKSLSSGRTLEIVPFKAGTGVAANEELRSISLMMVKGIHQAVEETSSRIQIIVAEDETPADFILKGYISELHQPSHIERWMGKGKVLLAVDGQLIDLRTGKVILILQGKNSANAGAEDLKTLALKLGEAVGNLIINHQQEKYR